MLETPKSSAANASIDRALSHLQQAEFEILAAIRPDGHTCNAELLEAHAALWDAIALLTKVIRERLLRD